MRRVRMALLLFERYAAIRSLYISFVSRVGSCKPGFPREGLGVGANVLSRDVRNPESNRLEVIANGNGVWEWGTELYVGKAGA